MAIYISGPISGIAYGNKPAFEAAQRRLRKRYPDPSILSPYNNGLPAESSWEEHMRADIAMLMQATHVCMLAGWAESRGAKIEYDLAHALGMNVFTMDSLLPEGDW